ncbi:FKBP-type peptidyl-prolyl cis-trans isomerase [Microbacterium sp. P06]|uniref:FKBP-type peptidyl-prolyl cis-trans isomerase n=1 Tax=unclassified Microbacterium TaxID=2609290 RepID=UPI003746EA36
MRRIPVIVAVTALAAAGLVGCSSAAPQASCDRPTASPSTFDLIDVSGPFDSAPDVEVRTPFHVDATASSDVEVGDGPRITSDDQIVMLDLTLISGETGEPLVATSYTGDTAEGLTLTQGEQTFPGLGDALECATEGSRVAVALAPDSIAEAAVQGLGLEEGESAIAIVDVRKVYLSKADGVDQFSDARGLPTVVRAPNGRPGIIVPDSAAPTEPVTQVLKKGDGDEVTDSESLLIHFTSVEWDDPAGTVQSTWDTEPLRQTFDALPPVIADALAGQPVGSQILVVQPAAEDADAQPSPALVYVIDILGVG